MEKTDSLQKKLYNITRGAYWFGIIGRMSIFVGGLNMIVAVFLMFPASSGSQEAYQHGINALATSIMPLISGWLFLFARDAFEAIEELIREIGEIV